MQINHVQYERRISDHDYGNRMLSVSAIVGEDEDVQTVIDSLQVLVTNNLVEDEEREQATQRRAEHEHRLDYEIERKERELRELKEKWERAKAFLENAGVNVRDRYGDAPF